MLPIICSASEEDYLAVNALVKEGHDEHALHMPSVFKHADSVMPETYYQELLEDRNSTICIAKMNETVIGFAVISIESSPPFQSLVQRKYGYIHDFGVKKDMQKQGVGKLLFEACMDWSKEMGATSVELNVWAFNTNAIEFYQHFGMESVSSKMHIQI
ncbi:alanine acetyltransferase [Solibacillus sp. R5-41]|uniref:GNAT family N-acetyltransferase n=1 Tax=Solibacillus sp. R5-41 TaxID=2048654 RepID=UPI000C125635|nr:alanine acetyltransferase [Solibacillus sp. R5-41]